MQEKASTTPSVKIEMLGKFSVSVDGKMLTDGSDRKRQMWYMLQYLIANRNKSVSQESLIDLLWEDKDSENPVNALKNLVYRVRSLTKEVCPGQNIELIISKNNAYCWNNSLDCFVDTEEFEKCAGQAAVVQLSALESAAASAASKEPQTALKDEEQLALLRRAVELYSGEYLPGSSMQDWVIIESAHLARLYFNSIHRLVDLLSVRGLNEEIISVCEKAISIYPFEESLHELLIRAYISAGQQAKAMSHYQYISDMFYEKMGVKLSKNLRGLMNDLSKSMSGVENDLDVIKNDLSEQSADCAFFCEYEIFKNLYRVEARMASRFGQAVFVALISLEPADKLTLRMVNDIMAQLKIVIVGSLRKSDIVARYSNSQYVLMLPSLTYENGQMVLKRIIGRFEEVNRNRVAYLSTKLNPLSPIN